MADQEQEIDTVLVLSKKVKLRTINGQIIVGNMQVFESEDPYVMVILVDTDYDSTLRMDVRKEDLSLELRRWLEGKHIRNPVVVVPLRIEEAMTRFVKFGKTPLQEDLIMWMLSRSELYINPRNSSSELIFGGRELNTRDYDEAIDSAQFRTENEYLQTSMAALKVTGASDSDQYRLDDAVQKRQMAQSGGADFIQNNKENRMRHSTMGMNTDKTATGTSRFDPTSTKGLRRSDDQGMFAMTRKLLGKSVTLDTIKKGSIKGREGAKTAVVSGAKWNGESLRLCADIEKARKDIEKAMDTRRRMIEISKTRQLQKADKFRKIRATIEEQQGGNKFIATATNELLTLQKIQADIEDDILRQKNIAQRGAQKVSWTIAPSGYINRRGKSQPGPVLGHGPLHPKATSSLRDPRIETTMKKFYWDTAGRRHVLNEDGSGDGSDSLVDQAMDAIRRAAANVSAFKLDLKAVFREFDTSGDGLLQPVEMAQAFLSMGVKLDVESMNAIFKHFDPNDSGTVHFGEFVWGFFNRRGLVRQWKRKTQGLTEAQIISKFHAADINGDGRLNAKEFKRLLKQFDIILPDAEVEILMDRFDVDGDGDIDIHEFKAFIESEQEQLFNDPNPAKLAKTLPPPKNTMGGSGPSRSGPGAVSRPKSAVPTRSFDVTGGASTTARQQQQQQQPQSRKPSVPARPSTAIPLKHQTYPRPASAGPAAATRSKPANQTTQYDRPQPRYQDGDEEFVDAEDESHHQRHQRHHSESPTDESKEPSSQPRRVLGEEHADKHLARTKPVQDTDRNLMEDNIDVLWMTRMLKAQAEVEARLGEKYFN